MDLFVHLLTFFFSPFIKFLKLLILPFFANFLKNLVMAKNEASFHVAALYLGTMILCHDDESWI